MRSLIGLWRLLKVMYVVLACIFVVKCVLPRVSVQRRGQLICLWCQRIVRYINCKVTLEGETLPEQVSDCGITENSIGRLFVSNHTTFIDPIVVDSVLPSGFVAKSDIANWPFFGPIVSGVGTIYIDRGNKRALLNISANMEKALHEGRSVLMFPEGTTSSGEGILKLHSNLFEAAVKTGAPTIPLLVRYKEEGKPTTLQAWTGHEPLLNCMWRILCAKNLTVSVTVLPTVKGENRRELCANASAAMAVAMGCKDPLVEESK